MESAILGACDKLSDWSVSSQWDKNVSLRSKWFRSVVYEHKTLIVTNMDIKILASFKNNVGVSSRSLSRCEVSGQNPYTTAALVLKAEFKNVQTWNKIFIKPQRISKVITGWNPFQYDWPWFSQLFQAFQKLFWLIQIESLNKYPCFWECNFIVDPRLDCGSRVQRLDFDYYSLIRLNQSKKDFQNRKQES